jgi:hypothetical protein
MEKFVFVSLIILTAVGLMNSICPTARLVNLLFLLFFFSSLFMFFSNRSLEKPNDFWYIITYLSLTFSACFGSRWMNYLFEEINSGVIKVITFDNCKLLWLTYFELLEGYNLKLDVYYKKRGDLNV